MAPPSKVWSYIKKGTSGSQHKCTLCNASFANKGSTSNLRNHLWLKHQLQDFRAAAPASSAADTENAAATVDVDDDFSSTGTSAASSRPDSATSLKRKRTDTLEACFERATSFTAGGQRSVDLTQAILYMIAVDNLPLSTVEGRGFRRLMKQAAPLYTIPSRRKITRLLDDLYFRLLGKVKEELKDVSGMVLTTDVWTNSVTTTGYLGLTAHYRKGDKMRSVMFRVRELRGSHTAEYLTSSLEAMLEPFGIVTDQVSQVVTDGASNIKKAVRDLFGPTKHTSCVAHLLNNLLRAAIEGTEGLDTILKKIKTIVTAFRHSVQASDALKAAQASSGMTEAEELKLIQDVCTRWNSTYYMLERFIELSPFVGTVLLGPTAPPSATMVTGAELSTLRAARDLLAPFEQATRELSSEKNATASGVIPIVRLTTQVTEAAETAEPVLRDLRKNLLAQILEKFGSLEQVLLYSTATVLDPRYKRIHFGSPVAAANAVNKINRLVKEEESQRATEAAEMTRAETPPAPSAAARLDLWDVHDRLVSSQQVNAAETASTSTGLHDDLRRYLQEPVLPRHTDILQYWLSKMNIWPALSAVALTTICKLATSVPAERLFSKAGNTANEKRNRLKGKRLHKLLFLASLDESMWFEL